MSATGHATNSLKALALAALERNKVRNTSATTPKNHATNHTTNGGDFVASDTTQHEALIAAAAEVCRGLDNVTPVDVMAGLCTEDVAELAVMADPLPFIRSFAFALSATRWRRAGIAPPWWNVPAHCDRCGSVYLWRSIRVSGCPWCWNRLHGVKIPRPPVPEVVL